MRKLKKINVLDKKIKKLQDCIHNNRYRHPELADCELRAELDGKMAKPLQTSIADSLNASNQAVSGSQSNEVSKLGSKEVSKICHLERSERAQTHEILRLSPQNDDNFTLAPWGEGVRRTGEGSRVEGKVCKIAFTLAEVLITLGIIGVVAALTLPSVVAHYKEKVLVTQVKKAYSEMQNALKMYSAQNGCSDITCISDTNQTSAELADKLYAQFQGAQKCPGTWNPRLKMCKSILVKSNTPYYINGITAHSESFIPYFISADGVAYYVTQYNQCPRLTEYTILDQNGYPILDKNGQPKKSQYTADFCAIIHFDANGVNKGPNQFGADIYRFDFLFDSKSLSKNESMTSVLTKGKLKYTPYEIGKPKN